MSSSLAMFAARIAAPTCVQVFSGNEQVVLNVGGVKFTTTQLTLQNAPAPSLFAAMFSGRHTLKADQVTRPFAIQTNLDHCASVIY